MNTLTRILLAALGIVVLLFVAIAIAVAFIFEPNDYRPFLVDSVRQATGRDFSLAGDLSLELFPCCGVSVGSATLGNPSDFPPTPFASIDSASVSVKLWPLLSRREVQIGTVTLEGLDVNLIELPDGRTNWNFETGAPAPDAEPADASPIAALTIEGLDVSGGTVTYSGADGARYSARDIRVDAGAIGGAAPVPVTLRLTARDEAQDTTAAIELAGTLEVDGSSMTLNQPRLVVEATGRAIPAGQADAELTAAALRYDTTAGAGEARDLDASLALPGIRLEVRGNVQLADAAVTGSGEFTLPEGEVRALLEALPALGYTPAGSDALRRLTGRGHWTLTTSGASLSDLDFLLDGSVVRGSAAIASFESGAATASLDIDRLNLDDYLPQAAPTTAAVVATPTEVPFESIADLLLDARVKVGELIASGTKLDGFDARLRNDGRNLSVAVEAGLFGGRATLSGAGNPAGAAARLAGELTVDGISPRTALMVFGESVETANPDALARLGGSTRWQLGRRSLALEQMSWQLDGTRLSGTLGIENFDAPATRFDLTLDRLNLDDYLAPDPDETGTADGDDVEIPVELIRGLDVQGQLKAAALRVADLDLTNLAASVSARNGILRLEPLSANLYGGAYRGTIVIDATGARSRLSVDQQVSAVQIGPLLGALVGSDRIAGALTFNLTGTGEGNTQMELLKGLTGNVGFDLSDGVYHGMDIAYEIENAQSLFKRSAAPERPNRKETPIRALSFKGNLADGVLGSNDLKAEIPFLKLAGKGGVNLISRTLDYQLNAQVQKSAENAADARLKGLSGSTIPLRITGAMADPSVRVDLQGLVVDTVKDKARNALLKGLGLSEEKPAAGTAGTVSPSATPEAGTTDSTDTPADALQETTAPAAETAAAGTSSQTPTTRELLERGLRGLLTKPAAEAPEAEAPEAETKDSGQN